MPGDAIKIRDTHTAAMPHLAAVLLSPTLFPFLSKSVTPSCSSLCGNAHMSTWAQCTMMLMLIANAIHKKLATIICDYIPIFFNQLETNVIIYCYFN